MVNGTLLFDLTKFCTSYNLNNNSNRIFIQSINRLYHFPIGKTASQVNNLLNQNTEIIVSWSPDGKEPAENLALGHVFGFQTNLSNRWATSRVRFGSTTPGREYLGKFMLLYLFVDYLLEFLLSMYIVINISNISLLSSSDCFL